MQICHDVHGEDIILVNSRARWAFLNTACGICARIEAYHKQLDPIFHTQHSISCLIFGIKYYQGQTHKPISTISTPLPARFVQEHRGKEITKDLT